MSVVCILHTFVVCSIPTTSQGQRIKTDDDEGTFTPAVGTQFTLLNIH